MRRVLFACLVLLVGGNPARGQNAPSLLYVSNAPPWEPTNPAQRLTWAIPATLPAPASIVAAVDGGAFVPTVADCDPTTAADLRWCHTITPALKALLDVPGLHRVVLAIGLDASAALLLETRPPLPSTCGYVAPGATVLETRPLGTPLQGFLPWNKVAGDNYASARIVQLRGWGWRVEWHPDGAGVRVVAACVGYPS